MLSGEWKCQITGPPGKGHFTDFSIPVLDNSVERKQKINMLHLVNVAVQNQSIPKFRKRLNVFQTSHCFCVWVGSGSQNLVMKWELSFLCFLEEQYKKKIKKNKEKGKWMPILVPEIWAFKDKRYRSDIQDRNIQPL